MEQGDDIFVTRHSKWHCHWFIIGHIYRTWPTIFSNGIPCQPETVTPTTRIWW